MKTFNINGVTGAIILDTRTLKKNNRYSIKYRITYNRVQHYIVPGFDCTEEEWKSIEKTKKKGLIELRDNVNIGFDNIEKAIKEMYKHGLGFSIDYLKKLINKGEKRSLEDFFDLKIKELKENGQIGSSDIYILAKRSVLEYSNKKLIYPSDITIDFLQGYERWMINNGNSYTTLGIYLRHLRAILNIAKKSFELSEIAYPFGKGKYEIPASQGIKKALTLLQIKEVLNCPLRPFSKDELYRDLWLFSYLCNGMNVYDICKLKYSNIIDGELVFLRHKTIYTSKKKKFIQALITLEVQNIINKWGNSDSINENYVFPFLIGISDLEKEKAKVKIVTKSINKCMKVIGEKTKIGKISTYTARHSFATVLKRSGTNIAYISESLGHTSLNTTENYLASFEKEERIKNSKLLLNY